MAAIIQSPGFSRESSPSLRVPLVIKVLFMADAILVLLYLGNQVAGEPSYFLTHFLDLNGEANLPAWYSSIQLACIAALAGLFARGNVRHERPGTWPLLLLPLIFLALSLDEAAQIHEWLGMKSDLLLPAGSRENTIFHFTGIWMFLFGIPFFAILICIIASLRKYLGSVPGVMTRLLLGIGIFAVGTVLVETLSNLPESGSVWYHLEAACEEGCEMLGVTFILWAFHDLLLGHGLSLRIDPVNPGNIPR